MTREKSPAWPGPKCALRAWLFEGRAPGSFNGEVSTVAQAVSVIEGDVEASHRVAVESVTVGDCELTTDSAPSWGQVAKRR